MLTTVGELCKKEVVNLSDGTCLGFADDILIDIETRKTAAIIIKGKARLFGVFGYEDDISVSWDKIERVGEDIILVKTENIGKIHNESESFLKNFLKKFFIK